MKIKTYFEKLRALPRRKLIVFAVVVALVITGGGVAASRFYTHQKPQSFSSSKPTSRQQPPGQAPKKNTTPGATAQTPPSPANPKPAPPPATPVPQPSTASSGWWKPPLVVSWQWQLSSTPDPGTALPVDMYDIDGFDTPASVVAALKAQGKKVVCYIETGAAESYRSDYSQFPASVLGNVMPDYSNERYIDIRNASALAPIMRARLDICKQKGFDAVEPDIDDSYQQGASVTGFPLTRADQIKYDTFIANEAHARGLSIGLKNGNGDASFVQAMVPVVDWALAEQCFEYSECQSLVAFTSAGKPVFEVEYDLQPSAFCSQANAMNFNSLKKTPDLDETRIACR